MANKMKSMLDLPMFNYYLIVVGTIISWIIAMQTNLSQSSGHGGFIPLLFPIFVGFFTFICYVAIRAWYKKYNWIVTFIGIAYNIYFAIDFYLTENII